MGWFPGLWDVLRTVDGLSRVEKRHGSAIDDLKDRTARLEAREPALIAEAKMASATAASAAATQHVAELSRRVGVLEEQVRQLTGTTPRKRLTDR